MKKPNNSKGSANGNPAPEKELFNRVELECFSTDQSIEQKKVISERRSIYPLCGGVNLTIQNMDGDYDLAHLELFGVDIFCVIRMGKNGAFLCYPSYKKDGEYVNEVNNFSKSLGKAIRSLLTALYTE